MILPFHRIIIPLLLLLLAPSCFAQNVNKSALCNLVCGEHRVSYPFGFSSGCEINLNCSQSRIMIGNFTVGNVTSDQILVNLPAQCNRSIEELSGLFGQHFAPTSRNGLLLDNCSERINDCVVPSRLVSRMPGFQKCRFGPRSNDNNISCYSGGLDDSTELLDFSNVEGKGNCSVLFSSIMVDLNAKGSNATGGSSIALNFQTMELGWWVKGPCNCDPNADCTRLSYESRSQQGFRCKCKKGYDGDGFAAGNRCRKISKCSPPRYMIGRCGNKVGIVTAGIVAGACLVAALALICYCLKKRSTLLKSRLSARRLICEAAGNSSVPFYPYKEIERATNGFSDKQRLGTGAYGTVYVGKIHNEESVAFKKIRYRDHDSVEQVMNEVKLLSSVSHPNLVRLLGCCIENGEQILVYEYMPNGTLSQHLQRERGTTLPWTVRLTIAAETSHAIAYLHSSVNPPIYHRDIKSSNILLDFNFNSKVADFGLSRFGMTDDSHVSTAPQGTPGYVDPQYHQNFHLSDKSDVYSFGVVLVEIITAMKVVDFSRPHSEINLAALAIDRIGKGRVDEIIDPFLEPNRDAWTLSSIHKVAELAFRCLAFHRDMRPSMMEVADELEQIRVSGWAPLEENIQMGSSVASYCSSPYQGSEKSLNSLANKKMTGIASRRLVVSQRVDGDGGGSTVPIAEVVVRDCSPVSVQDPWVSEHSSPSTNSLLGNVVR